MAGGGAYRRPGVLGTYQDQPGLSDFGQDTGGAYHSTNIYNQPTSADGRKSALLEWAKLQQQYPQYANHAHLSFVPDEQMTYPNGFHAPANGDPETGRVALNDSLVGNMTPAYLQYVLAKELGQAVSERTLGTKAAADAYMNAIGYKGDRSMRGPDQLVLAGKTWGQNNAPNAMSYEGYRSYPQDLYGLDFARALGRTEPGVSAPAGTQPAAFAYMQSIGMLPTRYSRPTTPQQPQPNVSDLGRGINNVRAPAQAPAVLPAQVNNPLVAQMQQRAAQQNSANLAMRGGPRNF